MGRRPTPREITSPEDVERAGPPIPSPNRRTSIGHPPAGTLSAHDSAMSGTAEIGTRVSSER